MAAQMDEYVAWAVLRHFRRFDEYAAQQARAEWRVHRPRARTKTSPVGVMGLGVLGARVAQALGALGFPVRGWSRARKTVDGVRSFAGAASCDAFLAGTRALVCLLPLTPDTAGILNRAHARAAAARRVRDQRRARRAAGRRRPARRCSTPATSPARRSTCSTTEPLPRDASASGAPEDHP